MPHGYQAHLQIVLHLGGQLQEAELVGNGSTFLAHPVGHLFLRKAAFLHEALITHGHLDGIQILPLDVLHYGHLQHTLLRCVPDIGRNHVHAGLDGRPVSAFTADNLILPVSFPAHRNGLDKAEGADGFGQFLQGFVVEVHAGLVRVGLNHVHGNAEHIR